MTKRLHVCAMASLIIGLMACSGGKKTQTAQQSQAKPAMPPAGTGAASTASPAKSAAPKSFNTFFDRNKVKSQNGLITVYYQDDKYYFELSDAVLGADFLTVTRYVRTTPGAGKYGGEQASQSVLRFEKGPENRVFLRTVLNVLSSPDSTRPIYQAVRNSNVDPIAASFDVKAYGPDSSSLIIDVTDFFKGDNQIVSLSPMFKRQLNLSTLAADRSYIETIRSFANNTEVRTVKTFAATPAVSIPGSQPGPPQASLPAASVAGAVTLEINTSFIKLPSRPMQRRAFDSRVGYFADRVSEFQDTTQRASTETFIVRWRLEPKPEDIERYKRGELVEPVKPIVYYIDPATPDKWKPYLIAGINDWQVAFQKAGFKNAIVGKVWPVDSSMSLEAANYSVIRYLASEISNAYGPNVHDPRSGEIFESHIGWYHNVMKLVHDWYFIQAAAVDPRARKMNFDDDLMGDLIRFVSSHEVGHTLGLRHNMGSSSFTPVEKLRDAKWVEKNGHTLSIMDYARFNYVAQPGDGVGKLGMYPRIGPYDMWAIEWGYRWTDKSEEDDRKASNQLIVDKLKKNPALWWAPDEGQGYDPRSQTEDLGDDAMKAGTYGINNLQIITKNLIEWTKEEGDSYRNLKDMYGAVLGQFNRYAGHVTKNIGGVDIRLKTVEEAGAVYTPTSRAKQMQALAWLQKNVFTTPTWLLNQEILNRIQEPVNNSLGTIQAYVLSDLLSPSRLTRMLETSNRFGTSTYEVTQLLSDVKTGLFSELPAGRAIDYNRRGLQRAYVDRISALLPKSPATQQSAAIENSDLPAIARGHLKLLQSEIRRAAKVSRDQASRFHLNDLDNRIENILNPK